MIEVEGLTKRFGDVVAVDRLSFSVHPGVVTGFLGPNGAGKTTTMRLLLGLDQPSAGRARIDGRSYRSFERPLRACGALLDAGAVHPGRSARNHLAWLATSNRISRRRVGEVLEQVGLSSVADRLVGSFSLGMRQRLGIAAALLGDPPVLLFDEPVNGLDPEGIVWVRRLLRSLAADGRTVFVSSHLMAEMALTAHRLVVIGRGRLVADSSVEEFVARADGRSTRVGAPELGRLVALLRAAGATVEAAGAAAIVHGLDAAAIGDLALENGLALHELTPLGASLEEAYMELTQPSVEFGAAGPTAER